MDFVPIIGMQLYKYCIEPIANRVSNSPKLSHLHANAIKEIKMYDVHVIFFNLITIVIIQVVVLLTLGFLSITISFLVLSVGLTIRHALNTKLYTKEQLENYNKLCNHSSTTFNPTFLYFFKRLIAYDMHTILWGGISPQSTP
jgi:hypothetical protein